MVQTEPVVSLLTTHTTSSRCLRLIYLAFLSSHSLPLVRHHPVSSHVTDSVLPSLNSTSLANPSTFLFILK